MGWPKLVLFAHEREDQERLSPRVGGIPGVGRAEKGEGFRPGELIAKPEYAQELKRACEQKHSAYACYNWGVHQAQTLGNEGAAVPSYKAACSSGLRLGCFNAAGIPIKSRATRDEGIVYFEQSCEMPHHDSDEDSTVEKEVIRKASALWALTQKYKSLSYEELFKKLSPVKAPARAPDRRGAAAQQSIWFVNQSVATSKSYFYSEPRTCAPADVCPARTKKYLIWGDLVTVESDAVRNGFRT